METLGQQPESNVVRSTKVGSSFGRKFFYLYLIDGPIRVEKKAAEVKAQHRFGVTPKPRVSAAPQQQVVTHQIQEQRPSQQEVVYVQQAAPRQSDVVYVQQQPA